MIFFGAWSTAVFAHVPHEGSIWATSGLFAYHTKTSDDRGNSPGLGGGIAAEGDVDYNGGVEIAMIYEDKFYQIKTGAGSLEEKIKRMYITTGYRHWFVPRLSFGGAFFSSYSMGDAKVVHDSLHAPDLKTSARDITEYGMDFSVQTELWSDEDFAVVADGRYSWSLTRKSHEDADVYGVFLGVKYLVPKKRKAH